MSFIGTLHEISFYGLISTIICLVTGKATVESLISSAFHFSNFSEGFLFFMFWTSVLFIPIAIIGALLTRFQDHGIGLTFYSRNVFMIFLYHIKEEITDLVLSPFWFVRALFTRELDFWKVVDYIVYFCLIAFIVFGIISLH